MQQPSQSNPQQELPSVKVDPQQSQSQPVFKIENNILLTLNHGEFIVMAMTESMIIDVARFLAQRFTADNARLAILGISEEQIFLSCLDQAISTLATGLGIVIYHRDPAKKNSPPNLVGAFTWCDGFISRYHTQLRWIKSKPAATEKMKLAKRIDEEFLGPIAFKIQEYLELNGMFQPNLVSRKKKKKDGKKLKYNTSSFAFIFLGCTCFESSSSPRFRKTKTFVGNVIFGLLHHRESWIQNACRIGNS